MSEQVDGLFEDWEKQILDEERTSLEEGKTNLEKQALHKATERIQHGQEYNQRQTSMAELQAENDQLFREQMDMLNRNETSTFEGQKRYRELEEKQTANYAAIREHKRWLTSHDQA